MKSSFQKRISIFIARLYGGIAASIGMVMALGTASERHFGTDFWAGLGLWAAGVLVFCCTLPRVQERIAAWKRAMSRNWRALAALYAAIFAIFVVAWHLLIGSTLVPTMQQNRDMAQSAVVTKGRIVGFAQEPNHQAIFRFQAHGKTIMTTSIAIKARLGQIVPVYYNPKNPTRAFIGTLQESLSREHESRVLLKAMPWITALLCLGMLLMQGVLPRPQRWDRE